MRSYISADNGGSKIILEFEFKALIIISAKPNIAITLRELPILKDSPMALGDSIHFKIQLGKNLLSS